MGIERRFNSLIFLSCLCIWASGNVYDGEWKDDNMNGRGKKTWASGHVYVGEWKNDKCHGHGKKTWVDGKYTWVSGTVYVGDYKNDKKHGNGKITEDNRNDMILNAGLIH